MDRRTSDRWTGAILLALAVWYVVETRTFKTGFLSGPVGPRVWPIILGVLLGGLSIYLIVRPDPDPEWPTRGQWWRWGIVVASSLAYGFALVPLGFIVASTLVVVIIGWYFGGKLHYLVPSAALLAVGSAFLFEQLLGLPLPDGLIGF